MGFASCVYHVDPWFRFSSIMSYNVSPEVLSLCLRFARQSWQASCFIFINSCWCFWLAVVYDSDGWLAAAIQCLKRKKLYEQQVEQLGNFQLRIHDQVRLICICLKIACSVVTFLLNEIVYVNFPDDNARGGKSHNWNCWCFENWSISNEGNAESHVCIFIVQLTVYYSHCLTSILNDVLHSLFVCDGTIQMWPIFIQIDGVVTSCDLHIQ